MTIMAFVVMALLSSLLLAATVAGEWDFRRPVLHQTGDTSLGPLSVNWLAAMAFLGALLICLMS